MGAASSAATIEPGAEFAILEKVETNPDRGLLSQ
jgi:hypothetical protein